MTLWLLELILHDTLVGITLLIGILLWSMIQKRYTHVNSIDKLRFHISQNKAIQILHTGLQDPATLKASALEQDLFLRSSGLDALSTRQRQALDYTRELQAWLPPSIGAFQL